MYPGVGTDGGRPSADVSAAGVVVAAYVRSDGAAQGGPGELVDVGVVRDTGDNGRELCPTIVQPRRRRFVDHGVNVVHRHHERRARIYRTKNKKYKIPDMLKSVICAVKDKLLQKRIQKKLGNRGIEIHCPFTITNANNLVA